MPNITHVFSYFYDKTIHWSAHRHASVYLAGVSLSEASLLFPIPPDFMLVTMGLAKPHRALQYALIALLFSIIGSLMGYALGYFAMDIIHPYLMQSSYHDYYTTAAEWFHVNGFWKTLLAGFVPLPYRFLGLMAGLMKMPLVPFILACFIRRAIRFILVSTLLYYNGERLNGYFRLYIDVLGWIIVLCLLIYFVGKALIEQLL